jgi:ParB family transcriptional regulator, chromosome partitioning protein
MSKGKARQLRLDQLNLPQPGLRSGRRGMDALVASVAEVGVLVPLVVRALSDEEFAVVAGAGRLEALRRTGAGPGTRVACVVVDVDDAEAMLLALVENVVREDMRPFDEAEAARVLIEDYGFSQRRVAQALGLSQAAVSQKVAVFRLADAVVSAVRQGLVELAPVLALMPLVDDAAAQKRILARMKKKGLSATEVKGLVAAERFGDAAVAPLKYRVSGMGRVEARTTPSGKLRVVLEAEDRASLKRLWRSLDKKLSSKAD